LKNIPNWRDARWKESITVGKKKFEIAARIIRLVHQYKKPTVVSVNTISGADALYNNLGKTLDSGSVPASLTANRAPCSA